MSTVEVFSTHGNNSTDNNIWGLLISINIRSQTSVKVAYKMRLWFNNSNFSLLFWFTAQNCLALGTWFSHDLLYETLKALAVIKLNI